MTKALTLAPNYAAAHVYLGLIYMYTRRVAQGIDECERALALDPNLAGAHGLIGYAKFLLGRGAETEAHINEAFRLSPHDTMSHRWLVWIGLAKAQLNLDEEAVIWLRRGIDANRNYSLAHFHLASALARLGELDLAREAVQAGLAVDIHADAASTSESGGILLGLFRVGVTHLNARLTGKHRTRNIPRQGQ